MSKLKNSPKPSLLTLSPILTILKFCFPTGNDLPVLDSSRSILSKRRPQKGLFMQIPEHGSFVILSNRTWNRAFNIIFIQQREMYSVYESPAILHRLHTNCLAQLREISSLCTTRVYFDNMTLTLQKPCQYNTKFNCS